MRLDFQQDLLVEIEGLFGRHVRDPLGEAAIGVVAAQIVMQPGHLECFSSESASGTAASLARNGRCLLRRNGAGPQAPGRAAKSLTSTERRLNAREEVAAGWAANVPAKPVKALAKQRRKAAKGDRRNGAVASVLMRLVPVKGQAIWGSVRPVVSGLCSDNAATVEYRTCLGVRQKNREESVIAESFQACEPQLGAHRKRTSL